MIVAEAMKPVTFHGGPLDGMLRYVPETFIADAFDYPTRLGARIIVHRYLLEPSPTTFGYDARHDGEVP